MNRLKLMSAVVAVSCFACGGAMETHQDAGMTPVTGGGGGSTGGGSTGGGSTGGGGGTVDAGPSTVTVTGTTITSYNQGVSSVVVVIPGKGSTTSDANGRFTFTDVTVPYDIAVVGVGANVTIYKNVTRTNVRLQLLDATTQAGAPSKAKLVVTLGGNTLKPTASSDLYISTAFVAAGESELEDGVTYDSFDGATATEQFTWYSPKPLTGVFHALEILKDTTSKFPVEFSYATSATLALSNGAEAHFPVTLGAVDTGVMNVTASPPSGFNLTRLSLYVSLPNDERLYFYTAPPSGSSVAVKAPRIPGATMGVDVVAKDGSGNAVRQVHAGLTIDAPITVRLPTDAPRLGLPVDGAPAIDLSTQRFSWNAPAAASSIAYFDSGILHLAVVSGSGQLALPSLAELGLGTIPSSTSFTWSVSAVDVPGVDAMLDPAGSANRASLGYSAARTFVTK